MTIASILVLKPEIIILDEPTAGQDYKTYTDIMNFLDSLQKQGHTIVMITHDMQLMLEYSDRCLVVVEGKIIADDNPVTILNQKDLLESANLKQTSLFIWSVGMAVGALFMSLRPGYTSGDLSAYLFGSIVTVTDSDVAALAALTAVIIAGALLWLRPVMYTAFDRDFARSRGIPTRVISYAMAALVAVKQRMESLMAGVFSEFCYPILGPAPATVVRVQNRYRYHLTIRCPDNKRRRALLDGILREAGASRNFRGVTMYADVNPMQI